MLWQLELRERASTSYFQRLQLDPLLILQLLAKLAQAIAIAVASTTLTVLGEGERKVVVVLDTSASMKARDVKPITLRGGSSPGDLFCPQPSARYAGHGDRSRHTAAHGASEMDKDFTRALEAIDARSEARDVPNRLAGCNPHCTRASLATIPVPRCTYSQTAPFAEVPARKRPAGTLGQRGQDGSDNVAITQLSVRRTYQGASSYEAFLSLANFSGVERKLSRSPSRLMTGQSPSGRSLSLRAYTVFLSLILPFKHTGAAHVVERNSRLTMRSQSTTWRMPSFRHRRRSQSRWSARATCSSRKCWRADPEVALEVKQTRAVHRGNGQRRCRGARLRDAGRGGQREVHLREHGAPRVPVDMLGSIEQSPTSWTGIAHTRLCGTSISPRWRSRAHAHAAVVYRPAAGGGRLGGPLIYALEEPDRKAVLDRFRPVQGGPAAARGFSADHLELAALAASWRARSHQPPVRRRASRYMPWRTASTP